MVYAGAMVDTVEGERRKTEPKGRVLKGNFGWNPFLFLLLVLNKPNTNSLWFDVQAKSRYSKGQRIEYACPWLVLEFLWQS